MLTFWKCTPHSHIRPTNKKGKGSFYIAQYPVRWTAQCFIVFAFRDRHVHSDTNSASPGSILARQQLRAKTKPLTFPPLSIVRYSFKHLNQLGRQWRERKCPIFETVAKGDSNPGSLDRESGILLLNYRAPLMRGYMHAHLHAHTNMYTCTLTKMHIHAHTVPCMHAHFIHKLVRECMHAYGHTHAHTFSKNDHKSCFLFLYFRLF